MRSILGQSVPVGEIVLSDDASTDATVDVVRREVELFNAASPARQVELVGLPHEVRHGVTRNFQRAIETCRYPLIALCDQDDLWHYTKIADQVATFDTHPELLRLLHTDARLVDDAGSERRPGTPLGSLELTDELLRAEHDGGAFGILLRRNAVTGATVMLRRSLLEAAAPFPDVWIHDERLAVIAAAIGIVDASTEPTIDYRQHASNEIGVRAPTLRYKLSRLVESRESRNRAFAGRSALLVERLQALGDSVPPARAKSAFEARRAGLPVSLWRRVAPLIGIALGGGYPRYASQGYRDNVRDLIQPTE